MKSQRELDSWSLYQMVSRFMAGELPVDILLHSPWEAVIKNTLECAKGTTLSLTQRTRCLILTFYTINSLHFSLQALKTKVTILR